VAAVLRLMMTSGRKVTSSFAALRRRCGRVDALYVVTEPLLNTYGVRINTLALGARLPTMHAFRDYVESAGLMSYGPNVPDDFRRAAELVDKILRGAKRQPTKFDLVINLATAKVLGLEIPPTLLARATR
jgi:putative ABC transport system substrate-binding protein